MHSANERKSSMAEGALIDVEVAYAEPGCQVIVPLAVPEGTSAREAVRRSGLLERFPAIRLDEQSLGVFGQSVSPCTPLAAGDRVEIYRPLEINPKEARRARAARRKT